MSVADQPFVASAITAAQINNAAAASHLDHGDVI
jgi:hypothetical protein